MAHFTPVLLLADNCGFEADLVATHTTENRSAVALTVGPDVRLRQRSLRVLAQLLCREGFSTKIAFGTGALGLLDSAPPIRAVVIDLVTPDLRWIAAARYVRSCSKDTPIVFLTAHVELFEPRLRCIARPLSVFSKPLDYRAFVTELKRTVKPRSGFMSAVGSAQGRPHSSQGRPHSSKSGR